MVMKYTAVAFILICLFPASFESIFLLKKHSNLKTRLFMVALTCSSMNISAIFPTMHPYFSHNFPVFSTVQTWHSV